MKGDLLRFRIKDQKSGLWFWVYIYEDLDRLHLDAMKYSGENDLEDAQAVCQPSERILVSPAGEERRHNNVGVIRLMKDVGGMITVHECLHAAMWIYRLTSGGRATFGSECSDREEKLAYILDDLYGDLISKMYKFEVWK